MNVPAPEFLTDEQQLLYRRRGGFHIRPDTLRLLNTATGEPCLPPYRLYPIFYQELIFMSESTITHSANGVTCTIEMTADEYLVSTEPMLRMAALSKWATFPRGVSFAVSAVAFFLLVSYVTEISALCTSPGYGPQYAVVFGVVCLLLLHVFLLYDLRAYFVFCYCLFHRHAIRWRLLRCFGADTLCKQTVTFCSDSSIRCTSLHQPAADGPLAVLPKKRILCAVLSGHFLMILVSRSAAPRTDLSAPESLYKARISLKDSICISAAPFRSSDWESLLTQVKAMDIPILTSSISTRLS